MRPWSSARASDDDGSVIVVVALVTPVLFAVLALVIMRGMVAIDENRAEIAAESAALAAAAAMTQAPDPTLASGAATGLLESNFHPAGDELTDCADPGAYAVRTTACISFDMHSHLVRVRTPSRHLAMPFAGLAGMPTDITVAGVAEATWAGGIVRLTK